MRTLRALTAHRAQRPERRRHSEETIIKRDPIDLADLEQRMLATERLLSTLIAMLSARDPRLLQELQGVFDGSDFATDEAGRAAASTWARIARELKSTGHLIDSLGHDEQH